MQKLKPITLIFAGTIRVIQLVPDCLHHFFQLFQQLPGWVFMFLMDAYGLSLVSVQICGDFKFRLYCWWISCCWEAWGKSSKNAPSGKYYHVDHCNFLHDSHPSYWRSVILHLLVPNSSSRGIRANYYPAVIPLGTSGSRVWFCPKHRTASPLTAFMIGPIAHHLIPLWRRVLV